MISLFLFLLSSLACIKCAKIIKNDKYRILDIVHESFPTIKNPYISDILVLIQTLYAIILNLDSLSDILLIMAITQFCRVLCSLSTVLPPLKNYNDKHRFGGINGSGTEYIFSGHASYSALSAIYLFDKIDFLPLFVYNLISQFIIVASKNHYTVDVVLAWIIVPLIYGNVKN